MHCETCLALELKLCNKAGFYGIESFSIKWYRNRKYFFLFVDCTKHFYKILEVSVENY